VTQQPLILLFDPDSHSTDDHEEAIRSGGFRTSRVADPAAIRTLLDQDHPAAIVLVEGRDGPPDVSGLREEARGRGIPVLGLVDHAGEGGSLTDRVRHYDGWVHRSCHGSELATRLCALVGRDGTNGGQANRAIPIDNHLLAMIVHDVRNPLNVINLTLRVIEQLPPHQRREIQEDLDFLRDNAGQIEKILALLGDLCRLGDVGQSGSVEVDPRRFVEEIIEERGYKTKDKGYPVRFITAADTPERVWVDPILGRLAILSALTNASSATDGPLEIRLSGGEDCWSIVIEVDKPPPSTVVSGDMSPYKFERILGIAAERRGLDLAIASWISVRFGGVLRVEVVPGKRSSIVLDWPLRAS
jgi:signal transduction histidine kinase